MSFNTVNGIILKTWEIDSATNGLVVFTKEYGKILIYAQGVKTMKSKNKFAIQNFSHSMLEIFLARKKGSMSKLKTGYIINDHFEITKNYENYIYCSIICKILIEILETIDFDKKRNELIFDNYLLFLKKANNDINVFNCYLFFLCFMINLTGYAWKIKECANCKRNNANIIARFDFIKKELLCFYCLNKGDNVQPDSFIKMLMSMSKFSYNEIIENSFNMMDLIVLHKTLIDFYINEVGIYPPGFKILQKNASTAIGKAEISKYL